MFQQVIEPLPRGRIRYRVHVIAAFYADVREGYRLSRHFAATRERSVWRLTHLPTGRTISGATRTAPTLAAMRTTATRLERLAPWGRYHGTRLPGRRILHRVSRAFGWTIRRVA